MTLTQLTCTRFRCLADTDFRPGPGLNVVRGANAQGKTSLLEALLYLATARSHRTPRETELVRYGEEGFRIAARVDRVDRTITLDAVWQQGVKRFRVNGVAQPRLSDILGKMNVVSFFTEDIGILRGPASQRRRMMDIELSKIDPEYLRALQRYRQVLRQRNELLRQERPAPALLDAWDAQLAEYGAVLMKARAAFVEHLGRAAACFYRHIAGETERIEVVYRPDIKLDASIEDTVADARDADLKQGMTTRGPHRDEMELGINDRSARYFASQGQQRTGALALKLAAVDLARRQAGEYPVLALDDVLSELDAARAARLIKAIPAGVQSVVTVTDASGIDAWAHSDCRRFRILEGCIEEEK